MIRMLCFNNPSLKTTLIKIQTGLHSLRAHENTEENTHGNRITQEAASEYWAVASLRIYSREEARGRIVTHILQSIRLDDQQAATLLYRVRPG